MDIQFVTSYMFVLCSLRKEEQNKAEEWRLVFRRTLTEEQCL